MDRNVKVSAIVEKMNLKNLTPEVDYSEKIVEVPDINRPALQLTGYFEHFDAERIQVIGFVEYTYLQKMPEDEKERIYSMLLSYKLPGIVYSRSQMPDAMMLEKAADRQYPGFPERDEDFSVHGGVDPVAECGTGPLHLHPWSSGGRIRCWSPDHGRERYWKE